MAIRRARTSCARSLTLVGIVAGVASIIAVMTGISVIQATMEKEMSVLGTQTFQVQKWPAAASAATSRAARRCGPPHPGEADAIREQVAASTSSGRSSGASAQGLSTRARRPKPNISIVRRHARYPQNNTHYVALGRNMSQMDVRAGRNVAVIGYAHRRELFPFVDPIDREIRIDGRKYEVIGIFDEKKSAFGGHLRQYVLIPSAPSSTSTG